MQNKKILLIDNSPSFLETYGLFLESNGYEVFGALSLSQAREILQNNLVHLIITDLRATNDNDELDRSGLIFAQTVAPTIPKIIFTNFPTYDVVLKIFRIDTKKSLPVAVDFLDKKETSLEELLRVVDQAFHKYVKLDTHQIVTGGALTEKHASIYTERSAEFQARIHLKKMDYLLIIEPRQQGKTSLINYLMRHPNLKDYIFVYMDATTIESSSNVLWYKELSRRVGSQVQRTFPQFNWTNLPTNSSEWRSFLSHLGKFVKSQEKYVAIALDEVSAINFAESTLFFSILRDIHNSRQKEPEFNHLTFLLVGTFHPRDLVEDDKISPFNIAQRIYLQDFEKSQISHFLSKFNWSEEQFSLISASVYYWTGGQPYLTQKLCTYLRPDSTTKDVDQSISILCREDENHIPPIIKQLNKNEPAKTYLKRILSGEEIDHYPTVISLQAYLELLGLIKPDKEGKCEIRNRIYEKVLEILFEIDQPDDLSSKKINTGKLHDVLVTYFDEEELRSLCFDLNFTYDILSGGNKVGKARELITFLQRRKEIDSLISKLWELRPNLSFEDLYD